MRKLVGGERQGRPIEQIEEQALVSLAEAAEQLLHLLKLLGVDLLMQRAPGLG